MYVNEFCHARIMKKYSLYFSGFLSIPENCRLETRFITIRSKISPKIEKTIIIPLTSNFTANSTIENAFKIYIDHQRNISSEISQIRIHDITADFGKLIGFRKYSTS